MSDIEMESDDGDFDDIDYYNGKLVITKEFLSYR